MAFWALSFGVVMVSDWHTKHRDRREPGLPPTETTLWEKFSGWVYTFLFVCLSRIVFQTPDVSLLDILRKNVFFVDGKAYCC